MPCSRLHSARPSAGGLDRPQPGRAGPPPPLGHVELQFPTVEEVQALLSAGAKRNERWGMLLFLAVLTGARGGALRLALDRYRRREDQDPALPLSGGTDRGEKSTKGGRERWVVVAPAGRTLLEAWRARCADVAAAIEVRLVRDAFVVSPLPDGSRPVNPETFSSVVHKLCTELDMPHVHLHSLRHFRSDGDAGGGHRPAQCGGDPGARQPHAHPELVRPCDVGTAALGGRGAGPDIAATDSRVTGSSASRTLRRSATDPPHGRVERRVWPHGCTSDIQP